MIALLQRGLRAAFMRAEAVFNAAFGDKLNPLYYLGAISFFLFWIVGATGVVLYAFFDTSVAGAYASVEAITHGVWGAGSALRTLHRYASDAMVLTMGLHLARYLAFDRLRGFRWFSWVSGVVLLVLVYAAGANGYMLPWDRLAQFVTQASFEWMDWLPGFGGTLIRNFIAPEHVSDRLFSLLVFIHIGVPLVTLALMWVHVQRVPKAATQPPRPIALALGATLLLLSLLWPVASQGPADLRSVPATLEFDWFLLPLYPLVYLWPVGAVWALVAGAAALLLVLPWLTLRRSAASAHRLTLHPGAAQVSARAGETILEAGLRAGLALPYDCRAGGCGQCRCTVLHGRVDPGPYQSAALTDVMRARGEVLMCCAVPLEDLAIEVEGMASLVPDHTTGSSASPQRWQARVERLQRLSEDLMLIDLALPEGQRIVFAAGQYLNIVLPDGAKRAFSFANAPQAAGNATLELHVRRIPGGRFTGQVFTALLEGDALELEGPLGRFTLRNDSQRPILFVAGATGFAPVKSILEDAFAHGVRRPMQLYWGVRRREDLYLVEQIEAWQREHPNFRFVPVLSDLAPGDSWPGRRGLVHEAMLADHPDLAGYEVYACGSVRMVEAAVPDFLAHGLSEQFCFSDAFVAQRTAGAANGTG
jgi:CDP-4-dehydro-6-deoxyglucose reductase, E3